MQIAKRIGIIQGQYASFICAAVLVLCAISAPAQALERRYKIEAAYLYSFFNYITWPGFTSPQELLEPVVCIYGEDPILPYLDYVRSKISVERALTIRTVNQKEDLPGCHILFMRHFVSERWLTDLPEYILTVVEPDDPLDRGGMVELSEDGDRIIIKINQIQLEKSGFAVSSRLLNLAK